MRRAYVLLIAGLAVLPCAASPEIPADARPATLCLYNALKSTPGITGVDVYVLKGGEHQPLITYEYLDAKGTPASGELLIVHPPIGGYEFVGDFATSDNPVHRASKALEAKCGVDSGYVDQVSFTDPSERVDMGDRK